MPSIKTLTRPDGQQFKLGRKQPVVRHPRMHLKNYLLRTLPIPPRSIDYSDAINNPLLSDVLHNDTYGDCTCAGAFHLAATLLANADMAPDPNLNAATCLSLYMHLTGGQDTGLIETDVLAWWQQHGLLNTTGKKKRSDAVNQHQIAGYVSIDPTDESAIMTALWLFENLYFGLQLPDAWINPIPDPGFTWDVAGPNDPSNGHCFIGLGYDVARGVNIDTWGILGWVTWMAIANYCTDSAGGDLYTVLSSDQIARGQQKAPNGVSWAQLQADLGAFQ